jgi:murein L,D-transpeptidase YcbB/YkuD
MWTVPPGVLAETVLPSAKDRVRAYIRDRGLHVLDDTATRSRPSRSTGTSSIANNLPYRFTQDPARATRSA